MTITPVTLAQTSQAHSLIAQLAEAAAAAKQWKEYESALKQQLMELHSAGVVPSEFIEGGYNFKLQQGRTTITLDKEVKALIADLQQDALASGQAIKSQGAPFWVLKEVK